MNLIFLALIAVLPLTSYADEENLLAGVYSDCVRWTTMGGVETSKQFVLLFANQNTLNLSATFFVGTGTCEGAPRDTRQYTNFAVLEDSGNRPYRKITAQDSESKMYFQFVLTPGSAVVYTADTLPVNHDPMRMMILNRQE